MMRVFLAAAFVLSVAFTANASDYPYSNPLVATLSTQLMKSTMTNSRVFLLSSLPNRGNDPILGDLARLPLTVWAQNRRAPLVFLIPGLGGSPFEGMAQYLAEQYYRAGNSVIVMWSPTSWRFVLSQSTTGVFGMTPNDAEDLYRVLVETKRRAETDLNMQFTSVNLVGYSAGALHSAWIQYLDRSRRLLDIQNVQLLSPPLDINMALKSFDEYEAVGREWTKEKKDSLWGAAMNVALSRRARSSLDPNYYLGLDRDLNMSDDEMKWLIGAAMRRSLTETLFASQQVRDLGLLRYPATRFDRNARMGEAGRWTFADWLLRGLTPFWSDSLGVSTAQVQQMINWRAIEDLVVNNPKTSIHHSEDDFILPVGQLQRLKNRMRGRMQVHARGGHCGYLWNVPATFFLRAASH